MWWPVATCGRSWYIAIVPDYTVCRTLGHAWFEVDSDWKAQLGDPMTVRCERCMMERRDTVARSDGHIISRRYAYPADYRYERGQAPTRNDFRLLMVQAARERRKERKSA